MITLEKLKKYLSEVTQEEFEKHWNDVKAVGVNNGWLIASEAADIHNVSDSFHCSTHDCGITRGRKCFKEKCEDWSGR